MSKPFSGTEEQWDAFAVNNGGGFLQSWGWSRFQEAAGKTAYRFSIAAGEGNETLVQFTVIITPMPLGLRYAYVPHGPVIKAGAVKEGFEIFVGALRSFTEREHCVFARLDMPYVADGPLISVSGLMRLGFHKIRSVQPSDTTIVDLKQDESVLLANMHSKARYNVRVGEKHGVTVRTAHYGNAHLLRQDEESFWSLLDETSSRDKFHTHDRRYYETMLDALSPRKNGACQVKLWFAEHEGRPLAAALTAEYGDTVTYLHGASSAVNRQVMAPNILHWRIIQDAKARGFAKYDFWGVAPTDDPEHPWAGITRFKMGFGGRRESYLGTWEIAGSRVWYGLYRLAQRLRGR